MQRVYWSRKGMVMRKVQLVAIMQLLFVSACSQSSPFGQRDKDVFYQTSIQIRKIPNNVTDTLKYNGRPITFLISGDEYLVGKLGFCRRVWFEVLDSKLTCLKHEIGEILTPSGQTPQDTGDSRELNIGFFKGFEGPVIGEIGNPYSGMIAEHGNKYTIKVFVEYYRGRSTLDRRFESDATVNTVN